MPLRNVIKTSSYPVEIKSRKRVLPSLNKLHSRQHIVLSLIYRFGIIIFEGYSIFCERIK